MRKDQWWGCYTEGLKGLIHPDAFAHPAKVSLALAKRIYRHAGEEGWLAPGDQVLDPMAGVGVFGLVAATFGLHWHGIELEERFCHWAQQSIDLHRAEWTALGKPIPRIIQGDARHLRALVQGTALVLTSPPYADGCRHTGGDDPHPEHIQGGKNGHVLTSYSAIVSSPPYVQSVHGGNGIDPTKLTGNPAGKYSQAFAQGYEAPAAIIASPPYANSVDSQPSRKGQTAPTKHDPEAWSPQCVVSSPPFMAQMNSGGAGTTNIVRKWCEQHGRNPERPSYQTQNQSKQWPQSTGQIGNLSQQSYWEAMRSIYAACYDLLPPGGHCLLVLKGYVRQRRYVDLPMQTAHLLEHVGFTVLHYHKAMLDSPVGQSHLFDDGETRTSRKSFFRRLQEQRNPDVIIDHEAVLCAVKAETGGRRPCPSI